MKKLLPYILTLVILANIFAPFSVAINRNDGVSVQKNEALAYDINITVYPPTFTTTDTTIKVSYKVGFDVLDATTKEYLYVEVKNDKETYVQKIPTKITPADKDKNVLGTLTGEYTFTKLQPSTEYEIRAVVTQGDSLDFGKPISSLINVIGNNIFGLDAGSTEFELEPEKVKTNVKGNKNNTEIQGKSQLNEAAAETAAQLGDDRLPQCIEGWFGVDLLGCAGQLLYFVIYKPTAYFFGLAGIFFDWAFAYSITDTSYRSSFVTEGWGIVRDTCNLFFIFVLIYAAFGMILSIHSIKSKEIIMNTIIIGLLMNFSLFAGQIMIDTSNILARVFYNSEAIRITTSSLGVRSETGIESTSSTGLGELSISAALVEKVNPQRIILQSSKVNTTNTGYSSAQDKSTTGRISGGTFILIVLMASAVNIVGFIVFLSVGLIFIARVIGLWFALVFAPLAFFSYTVPQMQNIKMVGWKKWWPETMGLCFVAPIFMFFMYLVLVFLQTGFAGLIGEQSGPNWVLSVMIPFIFIMMLLMMAKKLAKDYSGEMGQMITGAVTTGGAMLLGGAALTGALLGRKAIGGTLARASRSDSSQHLAQHKLKIDEWKANGKNGTKPVAPKAGDTMANGKTYKPNIFTGVGASLNKSKERVSMVDHARHEMDDAKKKAGLEGIDDSQLSGFDKTKIEKEFKKSKKSDVETAMKKGEDVRGNKITGIQSEDEYKKAERKTAVVNHEKSTGRKEKNFTDADKKSVENDINIAFNAYLKDKTDKQLTHEYNHVNEESKGVINGSKVRQPERVFSKSNTGSWDVRNLSQSKTDTRANFVTKLGVGAIATIALAVRTGLKSADVDHGKGQIPGNFMKDLKETISSAIKGSKLKFELPHTAAASGHDDHGGDHGGGGHH